MKLEDLNFYAIGDTIQITGVIYHDQKNEEMLLCFFPDEGGSFFDSNEGVAVESASFEDPGGNVHSVKALNMGRDEWARFLRQTDLVEVEILEKASDGTVAKAIVRKSARQVNNDVTWACFRRDDYKCRYCGRDDVPMTADHLVLFTEGGPWTEENIVTACKKCNKKRGDTQYADWLQTGYYKDVSTGQQGRPGITPETHEANVALVATLDAIPRMKHKPTRRR